MLQCMQTTIATKNSGEQKNEGNEREKQTGKWKEKSLLVKTTAKQEQKGQQKKERKQTNEEIEIYVSPVFAVFPKRPK